MSQEISNSDALIDVRDVIERIDELEALGAVGSHAVDNEDHTNQDKELHDLEELLSDLKGNGGDHQHDGDWHPLRGPRKGTRS